MILTPDELSGKAMDWAYELMLNPDAADMRVHNGVMEFYINDSDSEYGGSGWYTYKRKWTDIEDARQKVAKFVGQFIIVPTDLVSPKYAHLEPEMEGQRFQHDIPRPRFTTK
jgi:hypothetical protein